LSAIYAASPVPWIAGTRGVTRCSDMKLSRRARVTPRWIDPRASRPDHAGRVDRLAKENATDRYMIRSRQALLDMACKAAMLPS